MAGVADLVETGDGKYQIISIREEPDERIRKYCLNPICTTFGLIASLKVTNKFLKKNPEFVLKERNIVVKGRVMDIITMNEEFANLKIQADSGDSKSAFLLGKMYEEGKVAGQSLDMAIKYYQLSSEDEAKDRLKDLTKIYELVKSKPECSICFEQTEKLGRDFCSAMCGHTFHTSCLTKWCAGGKTTCPLCRRSLINIEEKKEIPPPTLVRQNAPVAVEEEEEIPPPTLVRQNASVAEEATELNHIKRYIIILRNHFVHTDEIYVLLNSLNYKINVLEDSIIMHNDEDTINHKMNECVTYINNIRHFMADHHRGGEIAEGHSLNSWIELIERSLVSIFILLG